jgi:hypothetical protein
VALKNGARISSSSIQHDYEQQWHELKIHILQCHNLQKLNAICFITPTNFQLMPRLADRSVVIKPVDPIYIPAGNVERFISVLHYGLQVC